MLILSYENEFNSHVNENSFSYERMSTRTQFEKEAKGNSEMAYYTSVVCFVVLKATSVVEHFESKLFSDKILCEHNHGCTYLSVSTNFLLLTIIVGFSHLLLQYSYNLKVYLTLLSTCSSKKEDACLQQAHKHEVL